MNKTLYLIRGLPGSGKSTLAYKMAQQGGIEYFEADMYFMDNEGNYKFDVARWGAAHEWCFREVDQKILLGEPVIVSNTFTTWREMSEYVETALDYNYTVRIITCTANYGSVHDVPEATMKKMTARFLTEDKFPTDILRREYPNCNIHFEYV